jgi:hypothetical protein
MTFLVNFEVGRDFQSLLLVNKEGFASSCPALRARGRMMPEGEDGVKKK